MKVDVKITLKNNGYKLNVSSFLVFVACWAASVLCDGLVIRSEEFYRVLVCVCLSYLEASTMGRPRPYLCCCATEKSWYSETKLHREDLCGLNSIMVS